MIFSPFQVQVQRSSNRRIQNENSVARNAVLHWRAYVKLRHTIDDAIPCTCSYYIQTIQLSCQPALSLQHRCSEFDMCSVGLASVGAEKTLFYKCWCCSTAKGCGRRCKSTKSTRSRCVTKCWASRALRNTSKPAAGRRRKGRRPCWRCEGSTRAEGRGLAERRSGWLPERWFGSSKT